MSSTGFFTDRLAGTREPTNDLEGLLDCARYNEPGDMELLREYLQKHPDEVNSQDGQGRTVVHMAAANGRLDVLELLFDEFNPRPNIRNEEGNTALHFAALNNRVAVAELLLKKGWKASQQNNFFKTPLQLISHERFEEMEVLLLQHDESLDEGKNLLDETESSSSPSPVFDGSDKTKAAEAQTGSCEVEATTKPQTSQCASSNLMEEAKPTKEGLLGSTNVDGIE